MIKLLTKTPTRTIPDILGEINGAFCYTIYILITENIFIGFVALSKTEIKKDTKEINRGYSFTVTHPNTFI